MKNLAAFTPLLEKVAGAALFTAALAFGLMHLIAEPAAQPAAPVPDDAPDPDVFDPDEMDTTEYLLSGPNRAVILAAIERDRQGLYVQHDLIEL